MLLINGIKIFLLASSFIINSFSFPSPLGSYQGQNHIGYKHIYFNSTLESHAVWVITLFFVTITYESVKYICLLLFPRLHVRWVMLFLFVSNIYPNYYGWWSICDYINEGFYQIFYHHTYFIITELIVSGFDLNMCDSRNPITAKKLFFIICISSIHILLNGVDQFIIQTFFMLGNRNQNLRNVNLMIADIVHLFVCCQKLIQLQRSSKSSGSLSCKEGVLLALLFIFVGTWFGSWI